MKLYNLKGEKTSEVKAAQKQVSSDLVGSDSMTDLHFANFIAAIRHGEKLHSPVAAGNIAVTMLQLSNISWEVNRKLQIDSADGKIPSRRRSNEDVGTAIRERLGASSLGARFALIAGTATRRTEGKINDETNLLTPQFYSIKRAHYGRLRRFHSSSIFCSNCARFGQTIADSPGTGQLHLP